MPAPGPAPNSSSLALAMDHPNRLPPIQQMLSPNPALSNAWTAINHRQEGAAPTSPQTPYPAPHLTDNLPPHSHLQSHRQDAAAHARHSGLVFQPIDFGRGVVDAAGPARSPRSSISTAGKPITPERQDSFLLPLSHAAASSSSSSQPNSLQAAHSPETQHRNLLRESLIQPLTPPSDPTSTSTQSSRCIPPSHDYSSSQTPQEGILPPFRSRGRSHSGPVQPSLTATTQTIPFEQERSSMPPPPVPAPTMTSPPPPAQASLSLSPNSVTSQSSVKHPQDATEAEKGSQERCLHCNETWTYPPMNLDQLSGKPAKTLDDMHENVNLLHNFSNNYLANKQADFKRWKSQHCHCHDPPPSSKRKYEGHPEDETSTAKYSKRSESPSRLTPPPEQACRVGSPDHEVAPKSISYKSEYGSVIQVSQIAARVMGITGASRPAPYERPAEDSTNMWQDNGASTRRVNAEETAR